ncbi:MAG TPA: hypothetical protein VM840_08825 [Actinomycetota bacterium]|nr:hypothetical protein [Actinomycetota bacterium]
MFLFPLVAAVVSGLVALRAARGAWRSGRVSLALWAFAFVQFSAASALLAHGVGFGWTGASFRAYYLLGAILNVVWLGLGTVWLLAPRALALAATVVVVAASLYATMATTTVPLLPGAAEALEGVVPAGRDVMPAGVRTLSRVFSIGGTLVVLAGLAWSIAVRRRRAVGLALIAGGVVVVAVASELVRAGMVAAFSVGLAVGVGLMYLGFVRSGPSRPD